MNENTIVLDNPLKRLGFASERLIEAGQMGGICARAGIGKTSFVVQMGLHAMARGEKVLHISLDEPVTKINLWYREVFTLMAPVLQADESFYTVEDLFEGDVLRDLSSIIKS